jgi:hypothetical protein
MKSYGAVDVRVYLPILHLDTRGRWSASRLCRFNPRVRAASIHWIGDCIGPRASLHAVEKSLLPPPAGSGTPAVQPLAHRYTEYLV